MEANIANTKIVSKTFNSQEAKTFIKEVKEKSLAIKMEGLSCKDANEILNASNGDVKIDINFIDLNIMTSNRNVFEEKFNI